MRWVLVTTSAFLAIAGLAEADPLHQALPPLPVQSHGPIATVKAIYEAEMAFERRSEAAGPATAYAEFVDPQDALDFTGGPPARGAQAIAAAQAKAAGNGKLAWSPREIFASTGDMGAVWGDWSFTVATLPKPLTGQYVTVWRQTSGGVWKAVINMGTPNP